LGRLNKAILTHRVQWGPTLVILDVNVRLVFEQKFDHLQIFLSNGFLRRREERRGSAVQILEELLKGSKWVSYMERGESFRVARIHIDSILYIGTHLIQISRGYSRQEECGGVKGSRPCRLAVSRKKGTSFRGGHSSKGTEKYGNLL